MRIAAILVGIVLIGGCGSSGPAEPQGATVSGIVKLNGEPLKEGTIAFVPEKSDGFPAPVARIADGAFTLKARLGRSKVEIRNPRDSGKKNSTGGIVMEESIPAAYNEKTTLVADVTGDTKDLRFELKK